MPWKLARWKPCDGGCCVRSPRFPKSANLGKVDPERPAFMADCVYHLNQAGGTSPDGSTWRGGCALYIDLLQAVDERNAATNISRLRTQDITSKPNLGPVVQNAVTVEGRTLRENVRQWFFDTCWVWPVPTPLIQSVIDRVKQFGFYRDDPGFSAKLSYERTYTDAERAAAGQEFHVTDAEVKAGTAASHEPACCHYWMSV